MCIEKTLGSLPEDHVKESLIKTFQAQSGLAPGLNTIVTPEMSNLGSEHFISLGLI
jgi:hypothetical protein